MLQRSMLISRWIQPLRRSVLLAAWLAAGLCRAAEPGPQDPAQEQSGAYVTLIQADQARDTKDFPKAIASYRDALNRYERLARLFPDWEKDIVQYRLTYCANQIAGIVQKTGKSETDWLAQRVQKEPVLDERYQRQMAAVLEENRYLRKRLQEAPPEEDASDLKENLERLETENKRLTEQLADAKKNDQTPLLREMVDLREENKKLQEQRSESRQELEALQAELKEGERQAGELAAQIREGKAQSRDSEKQRAALQRKMEELEPLQAEKAALESRIRTLTEESAAWPQAQTAWSNQWTALNGELSALRDAAAKQETESNALREQLAESKRDRQTLQGQLADLTRECENARESLRAATAASEQIMEEKESQRRQVEQLRQEAAGLSNRLAAAEAAAGELDALKAENSELRQAVRQAQSAAERTPVAGEASVPLVSPVYLPVSAKAHPLTSEEIDDLMKRGLGSEQKGEYEDALQGYDRILAERPNHAQALKARGRVLLQTGDGAGALQALQELSQWAPDDLQGQLLLGMAYCRIQQFKEAVDVLRPLVVKDPSNISARNVLGAAWLGLGNMREARLELEKVLRMNPDLSDAHYNLAQVFLFSRPADLTQARRHYLRALELGAIADREIEQLLNPRSN